MSIASLQAKETKPFDIALVSLFRCVYLHLCGNKLKKNTKFCVFPMESRVNYIFQLWIP